MFGCDII